MKHCKAKALNSCFIEEDEWSYVVNLIADWKETAYIKADPKLVADIEQGMSDLENDDSVTWAELGKNKAKTGLSLAKKREQIDLLCGSWANDTRLKVSLPKLNNNATE